MPHNLAFVGEFSASQFAVVERQPVSGSFSVDNNATYRVSEMDQAYLEFVCE